MRAVSTIPMILLLLAPPLHAAPIEGLRGMVVSANPHASAAGAEMLRAGGTAADAAVAAAFVLAVAEPSASGIGGGGFALSRMDGKLSFVDFRETAPAAATASMFQRDGRPVPELSRDGALAAGVPGAVAGYLTLHERYGKLPRAKVLAPAIRLAQQGFVVDERYRSYATRRLAELSRDEPTARIFLRRGPDGSWQPPPWGTRLIQKELARTLEAIAKQGAPGFYAGRVGSLLAEDMKRRGGLITAADLAAYRPVDRAPLTGSFRGLAVATAPPPSAGGHIVLSLLAAMEPFAPETPRNDPARLRAWIETSRRVWADRLLFGDPGFTADPTSILTSPERIRKIVAASTGAATPVVPGEGTPLAGPGHSAHEGENTTHLCAVDAAGNAVSMTTTVNYWFGAGIVADGTGVLWNDEMDDFAIGAGASNAWELPGSTANAVVAGKRPLSSMAPTLVFAGPTTDTPVRLVVGAPGGPRIPLQVATAIDAHLRAGDNVQDALATPKVLHPWMPDTLQVERGAMDPATMSLLQGWGYRISEEADHRRWGNGNAIAIDPVSGLRTGSADPRGVGVAVAE